MKIKKNLLFIVILCFIIFSIFYYKSFKFGNNISNKNQEEIVEYILNDVKEYTADISVTVFSNKTENYYEIKQEVTQEKSIQEVLSPDNIKGIKIELCQNILRVTNTELNLEKIYNEYETILNNSLFLNVFIEDYKINISKNYELDNEIILETKLENSTNTYVQYKELHINKENNKITKLIIKDNTQNTRISILYRDIEIK